MFGFYFILITAVLSIAFMGGFIGFLIGKYWKKKQRMIERILEIAAQILNALATKVFKEDTYPYPPLSRRERRKFERDNKKS